MKPMKKEFLFKVVAILLAGMPSLLHGQAERKFIRQGNGEFSTGFPNQKSCTGKLSTRINYLQMPCSILVMPCINRKNTKMQEKILLKMQIL
jgi:hypothetical protein